MIIADIATITIDFSPNDLLQRQFDDPEIENIIRCLENPTNEIDFKK